jgi:hypothetical protein
MICLVHASAFFSQDTDIIYDDPWLILLHMLLVISDAGLIDAHVFRDWSSLMG